MAAAKATGGCLCGGVRFDALVSGEVSACHCTMCRRWTGGPMMAVHPEQPAAVTGDAVQWYRSSDWAERGFCKVCGTSLFYRLAHNPEDVIIAAGCFDDPAVFDPLKREIFVDEQPGFYSFGGDRPRMTGEEFIRMITGGTGNPEDV